jgi:2-succinyl-5-enolpyruvyl-6-hydroxy-3-cyclohexene-1-carboxylate synthase
VLCIGDVGFLHDSNGLLGAAQRGIDLVVVVIDNDGGGIFSFLPPATAVEADRFEQLYGTPHGLDLAALAAAYGVEAAATSAIATALPAALAAGGVHVVVVRTDRAENVDVHARLNDAVAAALAT